MKVKTKKGEVTVGTLVAIVLAIVVIAFLVYGFSTGWTNLWGKIGAFGGGESNVDDITLACQLACQQQAIDNFCNVDKDVRFGDERNVSGEWNTTSEEWEYVLSKKVSASCNDLSNSTLNPGSAGSIDACSKISC